jgi:hypothetical protein
MGKVSFTMDLWSDLNRKPFMAITAHWIKGTPTNTIRGTELVLEYRADLIGFYECLGRHTGKHLANAFLYVLDRVGITSKVCTKLIRLCLFTISHSLFAGWLDNAGQRLEQRYLHGFA